MNKFLKDVTNNLENFSYNKIIANFHEIYSFLSKQIKKSYKKNTLIILAWNFYKDIIKNNSGLSENFINIKDLETNS